MNREVIWSKQAKFQRKEILKYWIVRNHNKAYSKKLNALFRSTIYTLLNFPNSGRLTELVDIRIKIVKDYKILYKITETSIYIVAIVDVRRDPEVIKKLLE